MAKTYPRADLLEKEPTPLQKNFIRYIKAQTGVDVDVTTVVLFQALRTPFQKSDENRADLEKRAAAAAARRAEAESGEKPARKAPAKKAPAKKAPAAKAVPAKRPAKKTAPKPVRALTAVADEDSPFEEET